MQCLLCHHPETVEFLNLGRQPLANKYPATEEAYAIEDFFPLTTHFCPQCKNVQLGTVVSRARMFEDYYYLSSVNPGLVRHFAQLAEELSQAKFVVDIGSNDGILLRPLKNLGVKAIGVDPSINVSKIANDAGLTTLVAFFDGATAEEIKAQYGNPDVVVASSIFTHLENPHQFIEAVKSLMTEDGRFIVEVEYIGNILKNIQFERFYLDRIFYYSLSSLTALFAAHGMRIVDAAHIEPHGGSLRVTVCNAASGGAQSERVRAIAEEEERSLNRTMLEEYTGRVDAAVSALKERLVQYRRDTIMVAGYGAPARLSTICNYGNIGPSLISFVVDDSPLKQGRFTPGTHIPIVPYQHLKEQKPDVLVVFAYEYLDDIREKTDNGFRYLLPIPPREVQ
ncbi:MAG: class I SAM-dependent methyltransferase [Patescibacteria group bacterium]